MQKVVASIIGVLLSFIVAVIGVVMVGAVPINDAEVSWVGKPARVVGSAPLEGSVPLANCSGIIQTIHLEKRDVTNVACVYGDEHELRVARHTTPQNTLAWSVSYPFEVDFHELRGVCTGKPRCGYAPESDVFASPGAQNSLSLYPEFSKHLVRRFDVITLTTYYEFSYSGEPIIVKKGSSVATVGAFSFSKNGKWAIVEAKSYGFIRVDLQTFAMRRVVAPSSQYGFGNDPLYELAISSGGQRVAVMGERVGLEVYEVDETCGDAFTDSAGRFFETGVQACKAATIDRFVLFPNFSYALHPSFDASGARLRATIIQNGSDPRQVVIAPEGTAQVTPLAYLALGDSFTSGEGELSDSFYRHFDEKLSACHVSTRSYPFLLANHLQLQTLGNVACSGAVTSDIVSESDYFGQGDRMKDAFADLNRRKQIETAALQEFQPGIIRQQEFVTHYQPGLISIGVGGNDAGLIGKLKVCLSPGTCEWAEDAEKRAATAQEFQSVYFKLRAVLKSIKTSSPQSKVMVVGYPKVINETDDAQCDALIGIMLNVVERQFMNASIRYLNNVLKAAAESEGVLFVDIEESLAGHRLCDEDSAAMNGVRWGDDIAPISALPLLKLIGRESFHPTPLGHVLAAEKIAEVYNSTPMWPAPSEKSVPEPPSYWGMSNLVEEVPRQLQASVVEPKVYTSGDELKIQTNTPLFDPASGSVKAEIHSDVMSLGEVTVSESGQLSATLSLPAQIEEGYHTLHLYGSSLSGELLDVYQVIAVDTDDDPTVIGATPPATAPPSNPPPLISHAVSPGAAPIPGTPVVPLDSTRLKPSVGNAVSSVSSKVGSLHPFIPSFDSRSILLLVTILGYLGLIASIVFIIWKKRKFYWLRI